MVGVGDVVLSKKLGDGRTLWLHMDWESDEGLIGPGDITDGTLPGPGVTEFTIGCGTEGLDGERLQSFNFRGGGSLRPNDIKQVPAKVRDAFDEWEFRMYSEPEPARPAEGPDVSGDAYQPDAASRGENPYYPGLHAVPPGGYTYPNPTGVWRTEARMWLESHPGQFTCVDLDQVEALYAGGAQRVDLWFYGGRGKGCEVIPPNDVESRRKLIAAIRSFDDVEAWDIEIDFDWDRETKENSQELEREYAEAKRLANAKYDEELAQDVSDKGPWTVY